MNVFQKLLGLTLVIGVLTSCDTEPPEDMPDPKALTFAEVIDDGGNIAPPEIKEETTSTNPVDSTISGSAWKCVTTTYNLEEGRPDFALFNPNAAVIYPGNLLQGATLDQATPDEIVVKRAGGTISYSLLNSNTDPSFSVEEVKLSTVRTAMNNIIASSPNALPANFSLTYEEVQSEKEMALSMGVSVSNLAASVSGDFSFSKNETYNRYLIKLNQSYFTMDFDLPTNYSELFAPEVTPDDLRAYVGPGNPATYISSVTYGRIFYMLIEASESSNSIKSAIEGSFSNVVNQVDAKIDISAMNSLSELNVKVIAFGGDAEGTIDLVGERDLSIIVNRLSASNNIESGLPISYVVRNVSDNQIVQVKLATSYDVTECTPAEPGLFDFLAQKSVNPAVGTPYNTLFGDVNGDGKDDIILDHKSGPTHQIQVGLGTGLGNFDMQPLQEHPVTSLPEGTWTNFGVKVGDVNGDKLADLVWSNMIETSVDIQKNTTFIGLAQPDGSYDLATDPVINDGTWRKSYRFQLADINGDGKTDIAWNSLTVQNNRTYTALSTGTTFGKRNGPYDKGKGWASYDAFIGDINGDQKDDFIWEHRTGVEAQAVHTAHGNSDGSLKMDISPYIFGTDFFESYDFAIGDIDGDNQDDVVNTKVESNRTAIWMGFSNGTNVSSRALQYGPKVSTARITLMEDVDLDGRCDLIWNELTSNANKITLGLARSDKTFSFETEVQQHQDKIDWTVYEDPKVADIDGNGKPDIIWVNEGTPLKIAVALSQ